jgi:hypothetical protein
MPNNRPEETRDNGDEAIHSLFVRVTALEQALAVMADDKPQSPIPYETYKKLRERIAFLEVLEANHEGNFRTLARVALGFFSWLGGITTVIFAEWIKAQFFPNGPR